MTNFAEIFKKKNMRKKNLIIALVGMVSLLCVSCEGDTYVTEVTNEVDPFTEQHTFIVDKDDWVWNAEKSLYTFGFEMEELTDYIFDSGVKLAYMSLGTENAPVYSPLPFSDFFKDEKGNPWEEHFTIEWKPRWVTFVMKPSDSGAKGISFDSTFIIQFLY
ncbi:hypothetical protein AGMMS49965_15980 [Bacteroidia bacterium]|nr:hypothetical protein AGMMS49965_15980 [Bacteroidia bacterium]